MFGLSNAMVAGILSPLIIMQTRHSSLVFGILIHIAGTGLAFSLTLISTAAYQKTKDTRHFFMIAAFVALIVVETLHVLVASNVLHRAQILVMDIEISHLILLMALCLFGLGITKMNNKSKLRNENERISIPGLSSGK